MKTIIAIAIAIALVLLVLLFLLARQRTQGPRIGEIAPAGELQEKYGLYAENRPVIRLEPDEVPASLRDLIPMAEKWGIGDDIIRYDFGKKSEQSERDELLRRVHHRAREIEAWLQGFKPGEMSDAAAAYMYMLIACDEIG